MNRRQCVQAIAGTLAMTSMSGAYAGQRDADRLRSVNWTRERRYVHTSFGKIAYSDSGSGPPALFLHGFPLNGFQWRGSIETLSIFNRCIAPDLLGMGFTRPNDDQDIGPVSQAKMIAEFLDKLQIDRVHLVANDSGSAVAQLFAVSQPNRVRTLLLTNGDSEIECPPAALKPVIELAREGQFARQWLLPWHQDKELARTTNGLGGLCYGDPANLTNSAIDMYLGPLVDGPGRLALTDRYALSLDQNWLEGIGSRLRALAAPARILWGSADNIFSATGAAHLDRSFGRSLGIRNVSGAKLFWPEEHPKIIIEEALALWSAHSS